jgi:hypothetical protein
MPYFDQNPLEKLALQASEAEASLDLRGQAPEQALQAVEQLLRQAPPGKSFLIQFDPASGDGHETLFLPLGKRLLRARREGCLQRCLPVPDGAAYFILFAG